MDGLSRKTMKITLEVPDGFEACGITLVYTDKHGRQRIYSASATKDEFVETEPLALPREGANHESE